jgi:hypothetical protein
MLCCYNGRYLQYDMMQTHHSLLQYYNHYATTQQTQRDARAQEQLRCMNSASTMLSKIVSGNTAHYYIHMI